MEGDDADAVADGQMEQGRRSGRVEVTQDAGVALQVTKLMLGVQDLDLGAGSSSLAIYPWEAAAQDAGIPAEGSGFRGVSLHYIVASSQDVDEVIGNAVASGGSIVKAAAGARWGGYFGYFSDPDGHLWKVAAAS